MAPSVTASGNSDEPVLCVQEHKPGKYPFLLEIQSDLLSGLRTTLVIPLTSAKIAAPISLSRLNPTLTLDGKHFTVMTQDIAGIDRSQLGPLAHDLTAHRAEIVAAVDFVLFGI